MELNLKLGEPPATPLSSAEKAAKAVVDLALGLVEEADDEDEESSEEHSSAEPSLQLNLLPHQPMPLLSGFSWSPHKKNLEAVMPARGFDVNRPTTAETGEGASVAAAATSPSPNSAMSSFQLDFSGLRGGGDGMVIAELERASSKASDDDDNGGTRKKLRLSKEQSAFLEALSSRNTLLLIRTKLKQTEVDCEYLKQCCEKLTDENRRLQKELSELRALKTANPFYTQLPATTLSMCPNCERVASSNATVTATASTTGPAAPATVSAAGDQRQNSFAALFS